MAKPEFLTNIQIAGQPSTPETRLLWSVTLGLQSTGTSRQVLELITYEASIDRDICFFFAVTYQESLLIYGLFVQDRQCRRFFLFTLFCCY